MMEGPDFIVGCPICEAYQVGGTSKFQETYDDHTDCDICGKWIGNHQYAHPHEELMIPCPGFTQERFMSIDDLNVDASKEQLLELAKGGEDDDDSTIGNTNNRQCGYTYVRQRRLACGAKAGREATDR